MKYVVVVTEHGLEAAVVFSEAIKHKALAHVGRIVAAGFCRTGPDGSVFVDPTASSESLKLGPRPGDEAILRRMASVDV